MKCLAEARGVSEAEVIRQAIEREADYVAKARRPCDLVAFEALLDFARQRAVAYEKFISWEKARQTMQGLLEQGFLPERSDKWNREELYEERLSRYGRRND